MPIDSREKRASITGIHLYPAGPGMTNNATHDQEWRQEAGYSYGFVLTAAVAIPTPHVTLQGTFDPDVALQGTFDRDVSLQGSYG
jgi:hypothetical protein